MDECLFCKIIKGEIPCECVYEDEFVFAFKDINPQAPVHILVIPRKHIQSIHFIEENDTMYIKAVFNAIKIIAKNYNIESDYRIVTNHGHRAGQSVFHLHFHLLGGRDMNWPPG